MARPKKNSDNPSAVDRMESSFWQLLEEKPYAKISVGELVRRAEVNRNAFYYHFANLDELAEYALNQVLPYDLYTRIFLSDQPNAAPVYDFLQEEEAFVKIKKVQLIVGRHGSNELTISMQEKVLDAVLSARSLTKADLSKEDLLSLNMVFAGLIATIKYDLDGEHPIAVVARTRIFPTIFENVFMILKEAELRKKEASTKLL